MKLSEYLNKKPVIKVLCFGEGKTGKTTFVTDVFNLIDKGYHIIYIDCDKSMNIIFNQAAKFKYLDKVDYFQLRDEQHITILPFVNALISKCDFYYNQDTGEVVSDARLLKNRSQFTCIHASRIDEHTIIILDSLTSFAESMFNKLREKQLYVMGSFDKDKLYNGQVQQYYGVLSTEFFEFLDRLSNLAASVFVISHTKTVERKNKAGEVIERKIYPLSTTINASEALSKYFDECLYFYSRAGKYYVSAQATSEVCGIGGRQLEPKIYQSSELTPSIILQKYNHQLDEAPIHDIKLIESETSPEASGPAIALTSNKLTL